MRVAHVVTQLSVDGAFGGPARVAREQVEELAARGHDVTVLAGWDGIAQPTFANGVKVQLYRARTVIPRAGFAGLVAPRLTAYVARHGREFDIVHVHLARDLITMPTALLASRKTRLVVQPHGMIKPDNRTKSRIMDALATRRVLRVAKPALFLTAIEEHGLLTIAAPLHLQHLANGIAAAKPTDVHRALDDDADGGPVLFCARLHPRKRVLAFVEMAQILTKRGVVAEVPGSGSRWRRPQSSRDRARAHRRRRHPLSRFRRPRAGARVARLGECLRAAERRRALPDDGARVARERHPRGAD